MLFNSISFIYYFLPIILIIYFITPKKYKNLVLLISSLIFYMYSEPKYIVLMLIEIILAYIFGLLISKYKDKSIYILSIFIPILLLIVFKYSNFLITNINNIFNTKVNLINITLPIGISFYTFQIISYLTDLYKGKINTEHNFITLATYISMFPKLSAGPIVRYEDIKKDLNEPKQNYKDFSNGIRRFIIGLSKKVLLANNLAELINIINNTSDKTVIFYILYAVCYTLEVYLDFSSYSGMAIGLGKMFNLHFNENFNYPLTITSITEFWRNWHISLSSWFKDYIYIPLGGNKKGTLKQIRNILIVWILTGLWHGANWNFIIWGLYFGIILIIEKLFLKKHLDKLPNIIKHIYVIFIVTISFIIFNGENILTNIYGLFNYKNTFINSYSLIYIKRYLLVILFSIICSTPIIKNTINKLKKNTILNNILNILEIPFLLILLLIVTSYLIDNSYNPFLYFRF